MDRNNYVAVLIDNSIYRAIASKYPDAVSTVIEDVMGDFLERISDEDVKQRCNPIGYSWGRLFLPDHTKLRMKYKGTYYYAEIDGDSVVYEGKTVTPNQFVREVTKQARNAWITIWVRRPRDGNWHLADELRNRK